MEKFSYEMFCEYRCKHINELFAKSSVYKIGKNICLDTLCNIDGLNDISVIQKQLNYISVQKYDINTDNICSLQYDKILLTFNSNNIIKYSALIEFNFENDIVYINGKKFKVEEDREFTYKFLKTKIKAINGIIGFYEFCLERLSNDNCMLLDFINTLNKASNN